MAITRNGWDVYKSYSNPNLVDFPWVTGKVRGGDHFVVLDYIARRINNEVEKIIKAHSWGHNPRPVRGYTNVWSEHSTGTAFDWNAPKNGLGVPITRAFSAAQIARIRQIIKDVRGAARWGGEWSRPDGMHIELIGGNAKIKEVANLIRAGKLPNSGAVGDVKPAAPSKPKPIAQKPAAGAWPNKPLPVTDAHTKASDQAWRDLMTAIGYTDKSLGKNLQTWLSQLEDPRIGRGYYDTSKWRIDGDFSNESIKALQRKLYDTEDANGKRLYNGKADGKRGAMTVRAEIGYLNLPANRGTK